MEAKPTRPLPAARPKRLEVGGGAPTPPRRLDQAARKRLYTMREAAEYLAISYWTVRTYVESGKLPACRLPGGGKLVRIDQGDLDQFVEAAKV